LPSIKTGIALWSQATPWAELLAAGQLVDRLGYDTLFTDDHLYADTGAWDQDKHEAWTTLAAWAMATERVRLGHFVLANTFRNPGLVVKSAITVDHISGGRVFLGLGAGWFALEHTAFGLDFGATPGERLNWFDEAVGIMRALTDGQTVTHDGPRYHTQDLRVLPLPVNGRMPIMIGGAGEKKTLRTVAKYADMWHVYTYPPDTMRHKLDVLHEHCAAVGRDMAAIELVLTPRMLVIRDDAAEARRVYEAAAAHNRMDFSAPDGHPWWGGPAEIAERLAPYVELGFQHIVGDVPAPYDRETIERLVGEVKPLLERG
jgi:alkanesulfonate monooxygenase SsuD/methylene tetrahydromethanopterin reductase-like flavin-dependent oxidoreductase (luciferase family)